jgi:transcriptional regulator with XRE-family HTH domain
MNPLKMWMYKNHLTREEFASMLGISYAHFLHIISELKDPGEGLAFRIEEITHGEIPMSYWENASWNKYEKKKRGRPRMEARPRTHR